MKLWLAKIGMHELFSDKYPIGTCSVNNCDFLLLAIDNLCPCHTV